MVTRKSVQRVSHDKSKDDVKIVDFIFSMFFGEKYRLNIRVEKAGSKIATYFKHIIERMTCLSVK